MNDIMSAAVKANENELPVSLPVETSSIMNAAAEEITDEQAQEITNLNESRIKLGAGISDLTPEQIASLRPRKIITQVRDYKIGRNEKCPCGSGKKYKNCCLDSGKYEGYHNIGEQKSA